MGVFRLVPGVGLVEEPVLPEDQKNVLCGSNDFFTASGLPASLVSDARNQDSFPPDIILSEEMDFLLPRVDRFGRMILSPFDSESYVGVVKLADIFNRPADVVRFILYTLNGHSETFHVVPEFENLDEKFFSQHLTIKHSKYGNCAWFRLTGDSKKPAGFIYKINAPQGLLDLCIC